MGKWTEKILILILVLLMLKTLFTWYMISNVEKKLVLNTEKIETIQSELDSIRARHRR